MKISNKLAKEIVEYFKNTNFSSPKLQAPTIFDDFLEEKGLIYKNGAVWRITEKLITFPFKEMRFLIEEFKEKFPASDNTFEDLQKRFYYYYQMLQRNFSYKIQTEIGFFLCPYCQRNYITPISFSEGKEIKGQLDHFYPKSKYPFLACSIENLIPSCYVCNSSLKSDIDFYEKPHINPLEENPFEMIEFLPTTKSIDVKIKGNLEEEKERELRNHLNTFRIKEIYSFHTEVKEELESKFQKYNAIKRKHISKVCHWAEKEIFETVFHEYLHISPKIPLWKLKKDLFNELCTEK